MSFAGPRWPDPVYRLTPACSCSVVSWWLPVRQVLLFRRQAPVSVLSVRFVRLRCPIIEPERCLRFLPHLYRFLPRHLLPKDLARCTRYHIRIEYLPWSSDSCYPRRSTLRPCWSRNVSSVRDQEEFGIPWCHHRSRRPVLLHPWITSGAVSSSRQSSVNPVKKYCRQLTRKSSFLPRWKIAVQGWVVPRYSVKHLPTWIVFQTRSDGPCKYWYPNQIVPRLPRIRL